MRPRWRILPRSKTLKSRVASPTSFDVLRALAPTSVRDNVPLHAAGYGGDDLTARGDGRWKRRSGCGERKKALEGEPHERIRSEIGPAGMGRIECVTRLRKPEDAGDRMRQVRSRCRCSMWEDAVGAQNLKGGCRVEFLAAGETQPAARHLAVPL